MTNERAPDPFAIFERTGTPDDMNALDRDIEAVADRLIAALEHTKSKPASTAPDGLKPEDVRFMAYALTVHRTRHGGALSEAHLRLLAAALNINRPSLSAAEWIGVPAVKELQKFTEAANLTAKEPDISDNRLAKEVGVDRGTIRSWRKMRPFQDRVRFIRYLSGNYATEEDKAIADSWRQVIDRMRGVTDS